MLLNQMIQSSIHIGLGCEFLALLEIVDIVQ
jgi:hypothetical protein